MLDSDRTTSSTPADAGRRRRVTRGLLGCGVIAGPLYVLLWWGQAAAREGFDPTRHAASLLANGSWGWTQTLNFVLAGTLVTAAGIGVGRATGSRWGGGLLTAFGVGTLAAAVFPADPADGFPVGTPAGPAEPTLQGLLHLVTGGAGFLCLVAACLVLGREFARRGERGWAAFTRVTGVLFLTAFVGVASSGGAPALVLAFSAAVILGWAWLAAVTFRLRRSAPGR
ncbi:MAG: DUF998 domain-containing protein [Kineosporiaceae bacterium]